MKAFILAGGFATRLWPLTEKRAKPLLPLAGKPILSHIVEGLPKDMEICVSTNAAFGDAFKAWAKQYKNVEIVVERTRSDDEKLGALGAVAQWLEQTNMNDDLLLLTGDNYFGFKMQEFIDMYDKQHALVAAYDIQDKEKASAFGTMILKTGSNDINAFEEKPLQPRSSLVSTGCSILPASALTVLREHAKAKPDNVGGLFEELLQRGQTVKCFTFTQPWFDIGSFDAYLEATKLLVGENMQLGEGSHIDLSKCEGAVVIGRNTKINGCKLVNTVIFDNCVLEDCVLEDCVIDNGCMLTHADLRRKMLRAETAMKGRNTRLKAA